VRIFRNDVKKPIELKDQRDLSDKEYKHHYYVTNDGNYMMLIFSKINNKGREIREHVVINSLEATEVIKSHKRTQNGKVAWESYYSKEGYDLIYKLKSGTMVLLYENNGDEIWDLDKRNLQRRLYIITKMKYDGRIYMMHHQEAREKKDLEEKSGLFKENEEYRPIIVNSYNQFKALVQGVDFEINDLGEIKRLI
jgi:CRISPR-associated endonuclease Csn1